MSKTISLLFKSSNSKFADEVIDCSLDWSIKYLKLHLSRNLFNNVTSQLKLIHAGKLLSDDELVGSVFLNSCTDHPPVVYVVASPSVDSNPQEKEGLNEGLRRRNVNASLSGPSPTLSSKPSFTNSSEISQETRAVDSTTNSCSTPPMASTASSASTNHNNLPSFPTTMTPPFMPASEIYSQPTVSAVPLNLGFHGLEGDMNLFQWYNPDQMAWMQQQYIQYMNQYMQYMHGSYQVNNPSESTAAPHDPQQLPQQQVPPLVNRDVMRDNNLNQNQPQQPQVQRMNAQGGALLLEDEDDGRNRDWLDRAHVFLRFGMLMCILFYYSEPAKFYAFFVLSLLFYLFQAGWLNIPFARERVQENAEPGPPAADLAQGDNANAEAAEENINGPGNDNDNGPQTAPPTASDVNQPANHQPGIMSLFVSLIVGFFTSLAPQVPPPVNVN